MSTKKTPFSDRDSLYQLIIETANEGIWVLDEREVTNFVNPKMATILGYAEDEMIGKHIGQFIRPMDAEAAQEKFVRGKQGLAEDFEFCMIHKTGCEVWLHIKATPILVDGEYQGSLAMLTDISNSKNKENELNESYQNYLSLFEDSPVPIWDEDFAEIKIYIDGLKANGVNNFEQYFREHPEILNECVGLLKVNNINQAVVDLNEAESKEEVLENYRSLLTQKSTEYAINQLVAIANNQSTCEFDAELRTLGGNIRQVHLKWSVVKGHEHDYKKVYLSTTDMTQRIVDENLSLQHANREKAVLLKEIHHRVKNNLQIITSLLNLQSNAIDDELMQDVFQTSLHRIKSMATVHELLYQSNDFAGIDYTEYLTTLVDSLVRSMKGDDNQIDVELRAENIKLNINTSIPLGLLINEIITNSLKHGIMGDSPGKLYVFVEKEGSDYLLRIGDDGNGVTSDIDMEHTETLGLQLVSSLTDQLSGSCLIDESKRGIHYVIRFKEMEQQG